jgi:hypothetical protein
MKQSLVMLCLLLLITDRALGNIIIENSWVRAAPPKTKVMAAYMTIENHSLKAIEMDIKNVISKGFTKTELHKSSHNGMMTMEKIETIIIKPNESLILEPGGLHFMLINPETVPQKNTEVEMLIFFKNENETEVIRIEAEVRSQKS